MISILTLLPNDRKRIEKKAYEHFSRDELRLFVADSRQNMGEILAQEKIDLVLMNNKNYSDNDMAEMVQNLRTRFGSIAIAVITRLEDRDLAMKLYRLGIDEWICRPYDAVEIGMRCRAILRRTKQDNSENLKIGGMFIDYNNHCVKLDDREIHMPKKEFLLMHLLLSHPQKVYTRGELMELIWGYDSDSYDATVAVHIGRIKKKFAGRNDFKIVSVRGVGYKAVLK